MNVEYHFGLILKLLDRLIVPDRGFDGTHIDRVPWPGDLKSKISDQRFPLETRDKCKVWVSHKLKSSAQMVGGGVVVELSRFFVCIIWGKHVVSRKN